VDGLPGRLDERRPQGEVLDRVAVEDQLREGRDMGPLLTCPPGPVQHQVGVAGKVADGGVDLGERESDLRHTGSVARCGYRGANVGRQPQE
jgi:hypothetical protein